MNINFAVKVITDCAKQYHCNLANKNLLFIFGSASKPQFLNASFLPRHFLHFTGVKINERMIFGSTDFYKKCLSGKLSPKSFSFSENGTTEMKLQVLPQIMQIEKTAKMVGTYDGSKTLLYTEKLAGGTFGCVGFVEDVSSDFYIPNTVGLSSTF